MTDAAGLVFDRVCVRHRGAVVVELDAAVRPGEILTLTGPSGSGKSTLLSLATGTLDRALQGSGRILLGGRDLTGMPPSERRIGIMFQDDVLFPHLSVGGNLAFGLGPAVRGRARRRAAVAAALEEAGLSGYAERDPVTLSGGQRARAALMRVLLSEPDALLLDEPFSKLDAGLRDRTRRFVFDHARARNLPVLLVTHDEGDAVAAGGPVIAL